jgi:hypothetical protein
VHVAATGDGRARLWAWAWAWTWVWRGLAWFCHSRLMIAGVLSLLHYGGYELVLILSVTVLSLPHLLSFRLALLLPAENKKSPSSYLMFFSLPNQRQTRNSSSVAQCRSPSCDSACMEPRDSRCLRNRCSPKNPARGVWAFRFLRSDYATARTSSSSSS